VDNIEDDDVDEDKSDEDEVLVKYGMIDGSFRNET
jgi:hypothetical protein